MRNGRTAKILSLLFAALLCLPLASCQGIRFGARGSSFDSSWEEEFDGSDESGQEESRQSAMVTFVPNNGSAPSTSAVFVGDTLPMPVDPQRENYIFRRWCSDEALTTPFDFSQKIEGDKTLYADYILDAASLTNTITKTVLRSVVTVFNHSYNGNSFIETSSATMQGSGVLFEEKDGYFYLLTNCHVAYRSPDYSKQKFTVVDCFDVEYTSVELVSGAISAEYDLACLRFRAGDKHNFLLSSFSAEAPAVNADVISVGTPKGQKNAVTFGKVTKYETVNVTDATVQMSNVTFPVISHTAFINNGSSGGPLFDADLNIAGINYAGTSGTNPIGCAIPVYKVQEFLQKFVYKA